LMIAGILSSALTFRRGTKEKVSFIVLNWVDLSLTLFALTIGAHEMNPLMRSLFESPVLMYAAKLVVPMFLAWLLPAKILIPSIGLLVVIVGWNITQLLMYFF